MGQAWDNATYLNESWLLVLYGQYAPAHLISGKITIPTFRSYKKFANTYMSVNPKIGSIGRAKTSERRVECRSAAWDYINGEFIQNRHAAMKLDLN